MGPALFAGGLTLARREKFNFHAGFATGRGKPPRAPVQAGENPSASAIAFRIAMDLLTVS
jgi:hypothetical protein